MELGNNNVQVIKKYEELVDEHYKEPSNGNFDDVTASILKELMSDNESDLESESETEVEVAANVDVEDGAEDLEHTTIKWTSSFRRLSTTLLYASELV